MRSTESVKRTSRTGRAIRPSSMRNVPSRVMPVSSVWLLVDDVDVPEARHVDAALDRRRELGLVGRAAADRARGSSGAGRRRSRPARARGRSSARRRPRARPSACRARRAWATPSWISGSGCFGTPSASNARGSVRGKRGESVEVDRRRRDALAQAPGQRAAALGVGQAVEGEAAEEVEQRRRPRRARARPGTRRARARPAPAA